MRRVALLIIATGEKYRTYIKPLIESANKYLIEHDTILFTDTDYFDEMTIVYQKDAEGYPNETLHRYHTFLKIESLLDEYDQIFYVDIDAVFVAPVGEEIFSGGITATLHPGYVGTSGTPERRIESMVAIPPGSSNKYFCGGFNGGNAQEFIHMARYIRDLIDIDTANGIIPIWHDESATNYYLYHNPPAKILGPSYCYPENAGPHYLDKWAAAGINPTPKILALTKDGR